MEARNTNTTFQTGLETLLRWDTEVLVAVRRIERRGLRTVMRALTRAGDTPGWIVHGAVLHFLLPAGQHSVALMGLAGLIATISCQAAKRFVRRSRPDAAIAGFTALAANPDAYSFPSGHSTVAFAIATAAMGVNPSLGIVETTLAAAIACSRVYLGAHYPVDVLAGIALGFACGLLALASLG